MMRARTSSGVLMRTDWPNIVAPIGHVPCPLTGCCSPMLRSAIGCRASPIFTTAARLASITSSTTIGGRAARRTSRSPPPPSSPSSAFLTSSRCFCAEALVDVHPEEVDLVQLEIAAHGVVVGEDHRRRAPFAPPQAGELRHPVPAGQRHRADDRVLDALRRAIRAGSAPN